jgi:rhodanese-related sulfurtransferase
MSYGSITPKELRERIERGDDVLLIDVREPDEHAVAAIKSARLLPLSLYNDWVEALDPAQETVVMCHHGIRSAQVCAYLARQGFTNLYNLSGGIDRWSLEVDPAVPRY